MLVRVLVPAGWMPATGSDGLMRISLCAGTGAQTAWIDRDGAIHKEMPASDHDDPQPCGFSALSFSLDVAPVFALAVAVALADVTAPQSRLTPGIGQGLVAPPPPSTGPPILI